MQAWRHRIIDAIYDGREIPTQREKHHSYVLRFKLRAVSPARNTSAVQEFEVDIIKHPSRLNAPLQMLLGDKRPGV